MIHISKYFLLLVVILLSSTSYAQRDTISTDKLIIIKPYSPTVNDAFKIKQKPSEKDTIKQKRRPVSYSFIEVPVASTFTPSKGIASGVKMLPPKKRYENYARFGAGNYSTLVADFLTNFNINRARAVDIGFSHKSSQGGIDGVKLDDDYSDTSLDFKLASKDRYFNWNTGLNVNHRELNYYGLSETISSNLTTDVLNTINPKQTYTQLAAFGEIEFLEGLLKHVNLDLQHFSDDYSSSEQFVALASTLNFPIGYQNLDVDTDIQFLNGGFESSFYDANAIDYQQFMANLNPSFRLDYEFLNLKLGAKAVYFNDFENNSNDIFFYPDVEAKFLFNENAIEVFLGVNGGLEQNSYENFSQNNPFVSPTLRIAPTDNEYKAFAGLSSKVLEKLSITAKATYLSAIDFSFFRANPEFENLNSTPPKRNFDYQNSFDVVYNDLDILSFSAEVLYQIESDFSLGFEGTYSSFTTEEGQDAWNMPELELKAYANYSFINKWNFSATVFYVGERIDTLQNVSVQTSGLPLTTGLFRSTLDSYTDVNASVEYAITPRLSAFISAHNLLNNSYNRWQNFQVQGFQVLGGLVYQFDW